jgi:general secretion pathway protein C
MDWSRFSRISLSDVRKLFSPRTVTLGLMAVILYQGTGILYKVLTLELTRIRPATVIAEKSRTAAAPTREPADTYRIIAERNLFGTTTKAVTDKQAIPVQPQQDVGLMIDLKGTVAGEAKYGFAVVEERATRKQRLVKAGDLIAGAKVVRVNRNAIDLIVNNQPRTLKMMETKEGPILPPAPPPVAQAPTQATPGGAKVVSRSELDEALTDMGSMLRQAQIRPFFTAGAPDGFLINQIRPGSLYTKMGILDGDIIQEVNSRKIQTADDMMGLLNTIKSGAGMTLTIRRRGVQETLNFQFQ